MIAYLEFNRFPQNCVKADSDFRDLECQLFNNIISDSVLFNKDSKFIVVSSFPTHFSDTFTKLIVTSMFGRSNQSLPNECDNIHSWISLSSDLAFSHQHGIYGFKFPQKVFGDLFQRSHSFLNSFLDPNHLRPDYQSIGALLLCICKAECLASSSQTLPQFIRPSSLLSYTSK